MAVRQYWIGSFGPFTYNDANLFADASPHRFASDRPPIANDDVVRLQDLEANIQLVAAANIDNPAAELAGMDSDADGGLLVVYQAAGAANDEYTIYAWDSNAAGVADVPYVVAGNGGYWIAVAGKYHNVEAHFGSAANSLDISPVGQLGLTGDARVNRHIRIGAGQLVRQGGNLPTIDTEGLFVKIGRASCRERV